MGCRTQSMDRERAAMTNGSDICASGDIRCRKKMCLACKGKVDVRYQPSYYCSACLMRLRRERDALLKVCRDTINRFDADQGNYSESEDPDDVVSRDQHEPGNSWETLVDIESMRDAIEECEKP